MAEILLASEALSFDDVVMVPQYSDIKSRSEVSLSIKLNNTNIVLGAPVIASPMDTVSGPDMAIALWQHAKALAILHRYCSIEVQAQNVKRVVDGGATAAAAIGINGDYFERATELVRAGASVICVDVAHGHHIMMKDALTKLRKAFPHCHIMAGNVATLEGFNDLSDWGADSIRVGIGSGSICSTRVQTGHGVPLFQNILDISKTDRPAQLISDGGIKVFGDISKAIGGGADFVMMGSMFAGTDESPGDLIATMDGKRKTYRGMASKDSQIEWRGYHSSNEGISTTIPYKGPVKNILTDMLGAMVSGFSYSGARNITELQNKAKFKRVTHASMVEGTTHILTRT